MRVNVFLVKFFRRNEQKDIVMKSVTLWIISILITIGSAYYQRITGPTYPVKGEKKVDGNIIKYQLERSHSTSSNYLIEILCKDDSINGLIKWKRFKTNDTLINVAMNNNDGVLLAELPAQPAAGKLQYDVYLKYKDQLIPLSNQPVIIRFKDDVPMWILIPHIIIIFLAMLLSTRTGFEIFAVESKLKEYTNRTLALLLVGGMILGPLTQLYAFGELWTGVPFGWDLTDNKTLIAFIGWIITAIMIRRSPKPKRWIIFAAVLTFIIFLIPHSLFGSELDYSKINR